MDDNDDDDIRMRHDIYIHTVSLSFIPYDIRTDTEAMYVHTYSQPATAYSPRLLRKTD